jgi:hypothetical protein
MASDNLTPLTGAQRRAAALSTVTKLSLPPRSPQIGAGHELAFAMFDELLSEDGSGSDADQALLEPDYRHGHPYRDIVADYLARARDAGTDVERGFTMILSDMVATLMQQGCPDAYYYATLMRRGVIADGPRQAVRRAKARDLRQARHERRGARP